MCNVGARGGPSQSAVTRAGAVASMGAAHDDKDAWTAEPAREHRQEEPSTRCPCQWICSPLYLVPSC